MFSLFNEDFGISSFLKDLKEDLGMLYVSQKKIYVCPLFLKKKI